MNNLQQCLYYLFRTTEDTGYTQNRFLAAICIAVWLSVFIYACKKDMKKIDKRTIRVLGFCLFSIQIMITLWFIYARKNALEDSLPLYYCRISSIVVGYSLMRNRTEGKFTNYFAIFSVFGASVALIVPDMERYNFPHITSVSFILIHSLLLFESMYLLKTSDVRLSLIDTIKITAVVLAPIHIINILFDTNYSYTMDLPSVLGFVPKEASIIVVAAGTIGTVVLIQNIRRRVRIEGKK